jgi:hypothetical protein
VCETSWLTGTSVNGNANIDNVSNVTEELVEISIRHFESKVANEESLGWLVLSSFRFGLVHEVDDEAAAFQDSLVLGFDGGSGLLHGLEIDISESANGLLVAANTNICTYFKCKGINIPFAQPSSVGGNDCGLNLSELLEFSFEIFRRDIKQQVANVNAVVWGYNSRC